MKQRGMILALVAAVVLGLAIGSVGTATAGGLGAKQVRKIAAKVVKKKAHKLSVAHAASADTAGNANALGGQAPSAYQDRIVSQVVGAVPLADNQRTNVGDVMTIVVPAGVNFLELTADQTFAGNNVSTSEWFQVDDQQCVKGTGTFASRPVDVFSGQITTTITRVVHVAPGTHSVVLCGESSPAGTGGQGAITVRTVIANGTGGAS